MSFRTRKTNPNRKFHILSVSVYSHDRYIKNNGLRIRVRFVETHVFESLWPSWRSRKPALLASSPLGGRGALLGIARRQIRVFRPHTLANRSRGSSRQKAIDDASNSLHKQP